ncbi:uncharacterized protein LOC117640649 isoform X2 [Thrips palmi]|uniref:Uncharacterized protein LOC117640649 isoform X1 n=1 Tax=Thrips palmi TaxID=161013 RepID=A0A6P8Y1D5_THRPL|nr:uncharacterized protein LOC117640649 isoform X1 [Thrips palmi]XP_034233303.1 uncharacterized protein LOC117640649 isoform X2 [Thrips palmi]
MAPYFVLAALVCVAVAAPQLEDATCDSGSIRSSSGECQKVSRLHHGLGASYPSVDLLEGQQVEVAVQLTSQDWIHFQLCGSESCNLVVVWGLNPSGELYYVNFTSCNTDGDWNTGVRGPDVKPEGAAYFTPGQYSFVAEHRSSQLVVWLNGYPQGAGLVSANPQLNQLRLRAERGTPMNVTFEDSTCASDSSNFRCGDGSCVSIWFKCDGFRDCADGSDESDDICDTPVATVSVGEVVTVRVQHEEKHGHVDVSLCDNASCSTLALYGSTPEGALWFFSWTGCNALGANCTAGVEEYPIGRKYFPSGELVLAVQRRASELAVWLDGSPDSVANVTVGAANRRLRVRPIY